MWGAGTMPVKQKWDRFSQSMIQTGQCLSRKLLIPTAIGSQEDRWLVEEKGIAGS